MEQKQVSEADEKTAAGMAKPVGAFARACHGMPAMLRQFPHLEVEAISLMTGDCADGGSPSTDIVTALADMQREAISEGTSFDRPTRACRVVRRPAGTSIEQPRLAPGSALETLELAMELEGGEEDPQIGTVLVISGLEEISSQAAMLTPLGDLLALALHESPICFRTEDYGMHELRISTPEGQLLRCRFMVRSPLGEFAEALDHFHDASDWAWDGSWTEELEEALLGLVVALDDHFTQLASEAQPGMLSIGKMAMSLLQPSRRRVDKYLGSAIEEHDILAVGRAVGGIRSLVLVQSCLDLFAGLTAPLQSTEFYQSILAVERARYAAASDAKRNEVVALIARLIAAADALVAELHDHGSSAARDFVKRWQGGLRSELAHMVEDPTAVIHPHPFQQLRGGGGGYIGDMLASVMDTFGGGGAKANVKVQRAETTEAICNLSPSASVTEAMAQIQRWNESLVDDTIQFGTAINPFEVHDREPHARSVFAAIQSLLSLGFGYVAQGKEEDALVGDGSSTRVVGIMDRVRATLPLNGEKSFLRERRRRDRLKDVCRVLRAVHRKGQRLSLTVNSDYEGSLRALKEHHSDNWIGPSLEAVWKKMKDEHQAFAFELWLHEPQAEDGSTPQPRLVAADFGHPHTYGKAYYVATRFFDRECRTLMPGFMLAFAEAQCLARAGFQLWDLGGADASPMMQYKPQVAIEMSRSEFLLMLREVTKESEDPALAGRLSRPLCDVGAVAPHGGEAIPVGVVFENLTEDDLWGSAALRAWDVASREKYAAAHTKGGGAAKKKVTTAPKQAPKQQREHKAAAAKAAGPPTAADVKAEAPAAADVVPPADPAAKAAAPPAAVAVTTPPAAAGAAAAEGSPVAAKDEAKQHFLTVFHRLVAEGLSQTEAAAQALQACHPAS